MDYFPTSSHEIHYFTFVISSPYSSFMRRRKVFLGREEASDERVLLLLLLWDQQKSVCL